jgi:hypothetical protein
MVSAAGRPRCQAWRGSIGARELSHQAPGTDQLNGLLAAPRFHTLVNRSRAFEIHWARARIVVEKCAYRNLTLLLTRYDTNEQFGLLWDESRLLETSH